MKEKNELPSMIDIREKSAKQLMSALDALFKCSEEGMYDLETLICLFEICHKGWSRGSDFCDTHCVHMVGVDVYDDDALDRCRKEHCDKCPVSFIIGLMDGLYYIPDDIPERFEYETL